MEEERLSELRKRPPDELGVEAVAEAMQIHGRPSSAPSTRLEAVRVLRSACAGDSGAAARAHVLEEGRDLVAEVVAEVVRLCREGEEDGEDRWVGARCRLQLLHNLYADRGASLRRDGELLCPTVRAALGQADDAKTRDLACSVLLHLAAEDMPTQLDRTETLASLLRAAASGSSSSGFALLCLSVLVERRPELWARSWSDLSAAERAAAAEFLRDHHCHHEVAGRRRRRRLPSVLVAALSDRFKSLSSGVLVALADKSKNISDPAELLGLLELLCEVSSHSKEEGSGDASAVLRGDGSLLVDAVYLLRMMNDAGKEEEGGFLSPVSKASEVLAREDLEASPVYGMKRTLVRLVGNLCWEHRGNQDKVRRVLIEFY